MTKAPGRSRRAVFLDRDGVLNEPVIVGGLPHPPDSVKDLVVEPKTVEACRRLREAGLLLVVVTNQPDVARGTLSREAVDAMNAELSRRLDLDDVLVCPHDDRDRCHCRKPAPGLLLEASRNWDIDLKHSVMVGDRWRDVEAGKSAGCATVLVKRDYDERAAEDADCVVAAFHEAVAWIIRSTRSTAGETLR